MHSWNLLHAAVHPTSRLTFPVVNSKGSIHVSPFIFCTSQSHSSLHLVMLVILSTICRVWNFISSRTGQTEPYLSGQETFRRAFTDSKPGRPILRLSTSQVLQEFVHQATGSFWSFVWTARNLSTALLAKKSCLPSSVTAKFKYPLSIPWAKWLCPVFFQLIAKATLLHRDLTNDNPSWLLNPWVSGLLTSMVQLLNPPT